MSTLSTLFLVARTSLSRLPLGANQALGALLGHAAWYTRSRMRRVTETNLALCFPAMPVGERQRLAHRSLVETGKTMTETFWIWGRPLADVLARVRVAEGQALFDAARESTRGLVMATPHLGCWELCNLPLTPEGEHSLYMYRAPRRRELEPLLLAGRAHLRGRPAALDAQGIRKVIGELRQGGLVGVLPDQEPDRDNGVFAPFFATSANTMTLLSKFAANDRADVLFIIAERLPRGRGWQFRFLPADPDITSRDKHIATAALNRSVERCIQCAPEQYLWSYKRMRLMPDGQYRNYH